MIRCLAIDDEPLALQQIVAYIGKVPFLELAAQCHSATEARQFLEHDTVDAIFCDINMPDLNGMDFVKSLAAPPLVVFTTAYSEYAVEGFRVNAVDYLLKPLGFRGILSARNLSQPECLPSYRMLERRGWWIARHNRYSDMEAVRLTAERAEKIAWGALFRRDPVARRKTLKQILYRVPGRPLWMFFMLYLAKLGFLDGRAGFHYAVLRSFYEYMIDLKIKEARFRKNTP